MKANGFCLISPSGKLLPDTFATDRDQCWEKSFSYLYATKKWMRPYWKRWDESIVAAEKRHWDITKVTLTAESAT